MKKNRVPYYLLTQKEKDNFRDIGKKNCEWYSVFDKCWMEPASDNDFANNNVFRVKFDYTPEPEVIRCEVYEDDKKRVYDYNGLSKNWVGGAVNHTAFIGYEYSDGSKYGFPRRTYQPDEGRIAEYPVAVLFAK